MLYCFPWIWKLNFDWMEIGKKASYRIPIYSFHQGTQTTLRQNGHIIKSPKLYSFFDTNGFTFSRLEQEEGHDIYNETKNKSPQQDKGVTKPISTLCHCWVWGLYTKLRSLSRGQRKSSSHGGRRVTPCGSLRSLSRASSSAMIYPQGRHRCRATKAGEEGIWGGKWTNKRQVKVPVCMAGPRKGLVKNYSKSTINFPYSAVPSPLELSS